MKDERDLRWAVYTAAYDVLRDYDNHPDKDRGLIQAGDQRLPNLIADGVVARYEALRRQPSVEEVARVIDPVAFAEAERLAGRGKDWEARDPKHWRSDTRTFMAIQYAKRAADELAPALAKARQIAQLYKGEGG